MIIKLAFRRGGTVDQALSNGLSAAAYAHATKDYKSDMHHAKAMYSCRIFVVPVTLGYIEL